ncbi:MAG: hypothetical protein IKC63_01970 [Clostridia bacterium]|nr:hypothetical protein [Clostridia bacterium]
MTKKTISILCILTVLFSVLSMTSCGTPLDGNDAIAAMQYIDKQMESVKGFDVTIKTEIMGETMEIKAKIDASGETPAMYMTTDMMGIDVEATLIDGTMYMLMSIEGMTIKQKTTDKESIDDMMGDMDSVTEQYDYLSAEFISREDGLYVIKGVLTEEDAKDAIGDLEDLVVSDISGTVTYECNNEGKVSKATINYSYKVEGEKVDGEIEMTFHSLEIPTISIPVDADEYEEMTE